MQVPVMPGIPALYRHILAMVKRYLSTEIIKKKCYKIPGRIVEKYFEGMDPNQVDAIVEQALEAWFSKEAANVRTEEP